MATLEQEEDVEKEIKDLLEQVLAIKPDDLSQKSKLGNAFSFEQTMPIFIRIYDYLSEFKRYSLDKVSHPHLMSLRNMVDNTLKLYNEILTFNPEQGNPAAVRIQLIGKINKQYDTVFGNTVTVLAYLRQSQVDLKNIEKEMAETREIVKQTIDDAKKSFIHGVDSSKKEIESELKAFRVRGEQILSESETTLV